MLHWLDAWFLHCGTDSKFTKVANAEYLTQSHWQSVGHGQSVAVGAAGASFETLEAAGMPSEDVTRHAKCVKCSCM